MDGMHEAKGVLMAHHQFASSCQNRGVMPKQGSSCQNRGVFIPLEICKTSLCHNLHGHAKFSHNRAKTENDSCKNEPSGAFRMTMQTFRMTMQNPS